MASGQTVKLYRIRFGDINGTVPKFCDSATASLNRTCTNGTWSGDPAYKWDSCSNYPCEKDGGNFPNNTISFSTPTRIKDPDGLSCYGENAKWNLASIYWGPEVNFCKFGTRYYNPGTCGYHSGAAYACSAGAWKLAPGCGQSPGGLEAKRVIRRAPPIREYV